MSTRAIQFLKQKKIPFQVVRYEHVEKGAKYAADATGYPLEATIKTLVVDLGKQHYSLVLMPGDKQLSLKLLAKTCGVKRAVLVDIATAERITGYLVGGISPFGIKKKIPVAVDEGALKYDKVLINAGRRGTMVMMDLGDIAKAIACKVVNVAAP